MLNTLFKPQYFLSLPTVFRKDWSSPSIFRLRCATWFGTHIPEEPSTERANKPTSWAPVLVLKFAFKTYTFENVARAQAREEGWTCSSKLVMHPLGSWGTFRPVIPGHTCTFMYKSFGRLIITNPSTQLTFVGHTSWYP